MNVHHKFFLGTSALALAVMTQAQAATIVTVTPPDGATATTVFGINDHGVIAGSYVDANGVEHGFFGPLNGAYTTFDLGGTTTSTEPRALNDDGDITGFGADPSFTVGTEFLRDAKRAPSRSSRKTVFRWTASPRELSKRKTCRRATISTRTAASGTVIWRRTGNTSPTSISG